MPRKIVGFPQVMIMQPLIALSKYWKHLPVQTTNN